MHKSLLPVGWAQPKGYANGVICKAGETLYIGGQIGWNAQGKFATDDFVEQVRQALLNVRSVLESADLGAEHMARMTWYIINKQAYVDNLRAVGRAYQEVMGRNFPAMTLVQVVALVEDRAQVEIEVTAVK